MKESLLSLNSFCLARVHSFYPLLGWGRKPRPWCPWQAFNVSFVAASGFLTFPLETGGCLALGRFSTAVCAPAVMSSTGPACNSNPLWALLSRWILLVTLLMVQLPVLETAALAPT